MKRAFYELEQGKKRYYACFSLCHRISQSMNRSMIFVSTLWLDVSPNFLRYFLPVQDTNICKRSALFEHSAFSTISSLLVSSSDPLACACPGKIPVTAYRINNEISSKQIRSVDTREDGKGSKSN